MFLGVDGESAKNRLRECLKTPKVDFHPKTDDRRLSLAQESVVPEAPESVVPEAPKSVVPEAPKSLVPEAPKSNSSNPLVQTKQCGRNAKALEISSRQYKITTMDSKGQS